MSKIRCLLCKGNKLIHLQEVKLSNTGLGPLYRTKTDMMMHIECPMCEGTGEMEFNFAPLPAEPTPLPRKKEPAVALLKDRLLCPGIRPPDNVSLPVISDEELMRIADEQRREIK